MTRYPLCHIAMSGLVILAVSAMASNTVAVPLDAGLFADAGYPTSDASLGGGEGATDAGTKRAVLVAVSKVDASVSKVPKAAMRWVVTEDGVTLLTNQPLEPADQEAAFPSVDAELPIRADAAPMQQLAPPVRPGRGGGALLDFAWEAAGGALGFCLLLWFGGALWRRRFDSKRAASGQNAPLRSNVARPDTRRSNTRRSNTECSVSEPPDSTP